MSLQNKVAIVTGASRGIGRATALRLAQEGATVVVNYCSNAADAEAVIVEIKTTSPSNQSIAVRADVSKYVECKNLIDQVVEQFGRIDLLVLNAGILTNESLAQITEDSFDKSFGVNVKGPLFLTQFAVPHMPRDSRVIFFSSSLTTASTVMPNYALYNATKGAIENLSRVLAKDLGRNGITVNTVSPGPTGTELFLEGKSQDQVKFFAGLSPFNRLGQPEDIAGVVAFLCGKDSAWISGQNIRINGAFVV
ncbi:hypothetical protein BDR26DRAFT_867339 [Obelidium mucronatum]|nr:hypothetical protein BDR26DRAFT_867339 [Obelidium mucronatum]